MAAGVLKRIFGAEAWMARSSGSEPGDVANDIKVVRRHLADNGRDPATLTIGATQFLHVVETDSEAKAVAEQIPRFHAVMGRDRTDDDLRASYLTGTPAQMRDTIAQLRDAGLEYLILTPLVNDPRQLDLIEQHIIGPSSG